MSTVADSRGTSLYIGGTGDTANGGKGIALVTGAGSAIRMTGSDTFIAVGIGPQSVGQLTVADGAEVSAIGMNVGRSGGVGVLALDHGNLNFSGQYTGATLSGAFLSIGRSGGIGVATLANGSQLTLSNHGSEGASLNLGGTGPGPLGDGTLTVSGGSRIVVDAAPGLATLSVGRDGSALMRVKGGSTVDVGDGNTFVGRLKGSDGTLLISEHSALSTGWLGVGRNRTATGDVDGGTGTLVLINSTLTARDIVIGTNGFLGGNGTIVGSVVNHGIFSPGTSPGTMVIDGDYRSDATARLILEVEDDGHGGFVTDHVVFTAGHAVDLSDLKVEFRFLAHTDPTRFQASGQFDTDHFFQLKAADGSLGTLSDAVFASAQFSATAADYSLANFSYTTASGASFTATPVPEPASWALLAAGVLGLAWRARRMQAR
ncbi:MAG: hypothetical protein CFE45_24230 [Burkholderiales bacterium PBB5]|nr:MAG: hypothetical protein CFE45_24230 [Burkholderiales bacterium PBB5]